MKEVPSATASLPSIFSRRELMADEIPPFCPGQSLLWDPSSRQPREIQFVKGQLNSLCRTSPKPSGGKPGFLLGGTNLQASMSRVRLVR